jgi:hypothetical protein
MRKHLAQEIVRILRAVAGIVAAAAVAHADVQVTVGSEAQRAAVVVLERLRNRQQLHGATRIGDVAVRRAHA